MKKLGEQRLEVSPIKFSRQLLGITNLDREKNKSVRDELGVQNIVQEIEEYQHLQRMDKTGCPNRHKGGEIKDARGKDERTNFTLRVEKRPYA